MGTIISLSSAKKKVQPADIDALVDKAWELRTSEIDKTYKLSREALELAEEIEYEKGKALAIRNLVFISTTGSGNKNGEWRLEEALTIFKKIKHNSGIADCHRIQGIKLLSENQYKEALSELLHAFELYTVEKNTAGTVFSLSDIGNVFVEIGLPETALTYFTEALNCAEEGYEGSIHKATLLNQIGLVYLSHSLFKEAQIHFAESLKLSKKLKYKLGQAKSLQLLGELKFKEDICTEALKFNLRSLTSWKELNNIQGIADSYFNIGIAKFSLKKFKDAGAWFLKSLLLYQKENINNKALQSELYLVDVKMKCGQLAAAEKLLKNTLKKAVQLNDLNAELKAHRLYVEYFNNIGNPGKVLEHTLQVLALLELTSLNETDKRKKHIDLVLLTEKKHREIEDRNFHSQKNQAMNEVITVKKDILRYASHDLKSPLNSIKGLVNLLSNSYNTRRQIKEYTSLIEGAADQMLNLINDIQQASMVESGFIEYKPVLFDLAGLAKLCANSFLVQTQSKKQTILVKAGKPYFVYADKEKIYSVLNNLISNASKFSYLNQRITLSFSSSKGYTRCSIKDEGQGLTRTDIKDAFQQFKKLSAHPTNSEETTGLGLFICKNLVEANKGRIWVESDGRNKGSKFIFELPNSIDLHQN